MWEGAGVVVVASRRGTGMAPTSSSGGGNADSFNSRVDFAK